MNNAKRLLAVLLSVLMIAGVLTIAPAAVSAAETESEAVETMTYYLDVGESETLYLSVPESVHSALWDTNAPSNVGFLGTTNSYARVKATKYTSLTVVISCTYYYWKTNSLTGSRLLLHNYKDFYIKINQPKITIQFDAAGGSVYPSTKTIGQDDRIGSMPIPARSNYQFLGWYNTSTYNDVYESTTFSGDTTLRAKWKYVGTDSQPSTIASTTPSVPKPGKPAISDLSYNGSSNTLKWSAASNATGYQIARKKTGQSDYTYFTTSSTSYTETSVTPGVKYTYQVRAKNGSVYGTYSASKTVVTLTKPDNLTVSNKSNGIRAEWSAVSGAQKYKVFYKSEKDSGWKSATTSNTYYPLLNTVSGRKYAFQIQALGTDNAAGPYSAVKNIVYKNPQLSVKPTVTLANKSNGIRAEWGKVSGATKYNVYYKKAGGSWSTVQTTNNYYALLKLNAGTQYSVQVQPVFGSEKGAYSAVKSLAYAPQIKPAVTLANKSNGIRAEWGKVSGATKYNVYYKKSADSSWSTAQTANNYYPLLNLSAGTQYSVQVQPVFGSAKGMYSAVKSLTYIPQVKPEVTLANNSNGVSASWKAISGATKYVVYYKKSADSKWSSTETSSTSYQMSGLTNGTSYSVQVQPVFNGTKGLYSAVKSIKYQGSAAIPNVKPVLTVSKTTDRINLSWTAVSGADKYRVYFAVSTDTTNLMEADINGTTAYFSNPTKGLTYYFMVAPVFGETVGELSDIQVITF